MVTGTFATLLLIYLSPTIQVDILKQSSAPFPLKNPALITIPLSFLVGIVVSLLTGQHDTESGYDSRVKRMHLGG
jgi:cation/acetate symporter